MSTSNDVWNNFNVTMSISQSLDKEDPKIVTMQVESAPTNIGSPLQCKKIVFSLGKNFQPPLAVTFMWDGAELYFNYFKDQHNAKKTYAFNSWKRIPLEEKGFMDTSYVRVLHRLAGNGELNDNEKKLLMLSIINNIHSWLYDDLCYVEDNPTIFNKSDYDSLDKFTDGILKSASYNNIHDDVKQGNPCTREDFVKAMNNFFTKKHEEENKQQNNQNVSNFYNNNAFVNVSDDAEKNGCYDECISLKNCWSSIKSCFGGE